MRRSARSTVLALLAALTATLLASPALAAVALLRVGADPACDFRTDLLPNALQAAIDTVPLTVPPGDLYVIRVARNGLYTGIQASILERSVLLDGGYTDCADTLPDTTATVIDAQGLLSGPVMRVDGLSARTAVTLRRLSLRGGAGSTGHGLLVRHADVVLDAITLTGNSGASLGGGLRVDGSGLGASARLQGGSVVSDNSAAQDGGGIHCGHGGTLHLASDSSVVNNTAGLNGGGIAFNGCTASINAGGSGFAGLLLNIGFNSAAQGGGLSLASTLGPTQVVLGADLGAGDPRPLVINNTASNQGGGIFANGAQVGLELRNALIAGNTAGSLGGGLMARNGARVVAQRTLRRCDGQTRCLAFENNEAALGGAIGVAGADTEAYVFRAWIEGNSATAGGSALLALNGGAGLIASDSVIVRNIGPSVVEISPGSAAAPREAIVQLLAGTVADNADTTHVVRSNADGEVWFGRTIVRDDAATPVLGRAPGNIRLSMHCNVLHESLSVPEYDAQTTFTDDPGFIAPASGNYRLQPGGWAVDRCPENSYFLRTDHVLAPRPVDAPIGNAGGPYDAGAFEWTPVLFTDGFED